jgi:hypothetical protein
MERLDADGVGVDYQGLVHRPIRVPSIPAFAHKIKKIYPLYMANGEKITSL